MKKVFLAVVAVGIVGGSFYVSRFFTTTDEGADEHGREREPVLVEVARVDRQPLQERITYPGSVAANETVSITPRVTGVITAIHVELGDYILEGDPLVNIDDSEYVERLKQARANLELARAELRRRETLHELALREYERVNRSGEQGISTQAELDSAVAARDSSQAEMEVAAAEVARMQAALEEAQLNVQNTRIVSPLDGWVQRRHEDPGTLASPNSPVLTIVDTDPAKVVVYVPERELRIAETGRTATVSVNNGDMTFNGQVARVAPSLSMTTRTTEVVIDVPNPNRQLRPGMSADVTLVSREDDNALVIPAAALIFDEQGTKVFRVVGNEVYSATVEIGIETEDIVQVTEGLDDDDVVVVKGQFMLKDGDVVRYDGHADT